MSNHEKPECPENTYSKIVTAISISLVSGSFLLIAGFAWARANKGADLEPRVAVLEASVSAINRDTTRITKVTEDIQKDVKELLRKGP